jgi:two-component system response regulator AlgR
LEGAAQEDVLIIQERGRTERVPLRQVVYFKAELKYVTVRTAARSYILDGSLNELEEKVPAAVFAHPPQCPDCAQCRAGSGKTR